LAEHVAEQADYLVGVADKLRSGEDSAASEPYRYGLAWSEIQLPSPAAGGE
jgi:hypothetical protein